jgi:saccharopine dehydrogenase (NADP+, L-glutamate forming)
MARIHWIGTGLSTVPGIRRLITQGRTITLWNRTVEKAHEAAAGLTGDFDVRAFSLEALGAAVEPGDVVVSMLPGTWHVGLAELALDNNAHFVSSSYISPEMKALDGRGRDAGLSLVNEVGLDPGLDHLLAHLLVADYTSGSTFDPANAHSFRSYCGGFPKTPNDFRYKFSWSPLGVLKALKSPARSIKGGEVVDTQRPWHAVSAYNARLPGGEETFQAYPNRDSTPFMADYDFGTDWNVREFVRGTLRLNGWSDAWADIFAEIETLEGEAGDARLEEMSDQFWKAHSYNEGEPDRVVLCVELEAAKDGAAVWHKSYALDSAGTADGSAMARLVSVPVSMAIEAVLDGHIAPGVSAAPSDPELIKSWLDELKTRGETFALFDHLS